MKSLGWALIPYDWCPCKRRFGHRCTQREDDGMRPKEKAAISKPRRSLIRKQPCRLLGLGLPVSRNVKSKCLFSESPSLWLFCYGSWTLAFFFIFFYLWGWFWESLSIESHCFNSSTQRSFWHWTNILADAPITAITVLIALHCVYRLKCFVTESRLLVYWYLCVCTVLLSFPGSVVRNLLDTRRCGLNLWVGKIP